MGVTMGGAVGAVAVRFPVAPCPLAMGVGYGCESGKDVPGVAGFAGVAAPPLVERATCAPDWETAEEGITPGVMLAGLGVM